MTVHVEVTVVGAGNPLVGDDGVGDAVAVRLAELSLPGGVQVRVAGGDPLVVLEELEAGRKVLLVDAAQFDGEPGAVRFLRLDRPAWPESAAALSLHGFDLSAVFQLGRALDLPLRNAWIMAIRPGAVEEGEGLSPALARALPRLVAGAHRATLRMLSGLAPGGD
ncbi:MAG: hydrogenase maturation protease [Acidobacteria bacterium]|jgi:hydrogenase maturation protease|nr:hydrogenase maturation protease [Acidobacteriota bacterium]